MENCNLINLISYYSKLNDLTIDFKHKINSIIGLKILLISELADTIMTHIKISYDDKIYTSMHNDNIGNSNNDGNNERSKNNNTTKIFMAFTACIAFIVIFRMTIIKVTMHTIFIIVNT